MAEDKKGYGPAGCADGCATEGCGNCLLVIVTAVLGVLGLAGAARRRRGGRR